MVRKRDGGAPSSAADGIGEDRSQGRSQDLKKGGAKFSINL